MSCEPLPAPWQTASRRLTSSSWYRRRRSAACSYGKRASPPGLAEGRAAPAQEQLLADGVRVVEARVGDGGPYNAVADELRRRPYYVGILVDTLPPGVSRWLKIDLISRLRRLAPGREILHVVVAAAAHKRVAR
jgi:hypothetical protein